MTYSSPEDLQEQTEKSGKSGKLIVKHNQIQPKSPVILSSGPGFTILQLLLQLP